MHLKLSIKIPSSSAATIAARVTGAARRALTGPARARIIALVTDRATAAADKAAPELAPRYRAALRARGAVEVTEREVSITITDPVVVAVERGAPAFDMKAKLLARGKPAKGGGVYVDVVLRHKPGTVPQAMRTAARRAARPQGVGTVRLEARTEGRSFTRELNRGPVSRALGVGPGSQQVRHKRGIHDDLVRTARRRPSGGLSVGYTTIRRISSRSAETSWFHPGFKPKRALDDVLPKAKKEIAVIIREAMAADARTK